MAMSPYGLVHYYLVDHPIISQYQWKPGHTPGASPHFIATAVAAYLSLTFLLRRFPILPTLSSDTLRSLAASHNVVLCVLSLVMVVGMVLSVIHQTPPDNITWCICFPEGGSAQRGPTFFWGHVFYFSKFLEFVDTLLILLKGYQARRRLSFLHVYHHATVAVLCYLWMAAPQSAFPVGVVANGSVHVLMYGYYLMSALGRRPRWKKAVTDCQITQFLLGYLLWVPLLYLHFTGSGCSGMRVWIFHNLFGTSLLVLFLNFRARNYD